MSKMIEINLAPDSRMLRQFGWIALGGFALLALLAWQEWLVFSGGLGSARGTVAGVFLALGAISALFSLIFPAGNRPLYLALTLLSYPIGFVLSYVIMGVLFYGMITPVGILFRVFGRDPLRRRFEPERSSYWIEARDNRPTDRYFKQF